MNYYLNSYHSSLPMIKVENFKKEYFFFFKIVTCFCFMRQMGKTKIIHFNILNHGLYYCSFYRWHY